MKLAVLLTALMALAVPGAVQAAEPAAATSLVIGSKSYQSRVISDVRPDAKDETKTSADPVSVEPAAGVESEGEMQEGRDAIRALQEQMKLPRKN
jgi:hypothetical protein